VDDFAKWRDAVVCFLDYHQETMELLDMEGKERDQERSGEVKRQRERQRETERSRDRERQRETDKEVKRDRERSREREWSPAFMSKSQHSNEPLMAA
jgi:hypothetical protein